ncbi:MAG: hypothetical protein MJ252_06385 [archaeon]|nr:hypothetical protein [archaeon]
MDKRERGRNKIFYVYDNLGPSCEYKMEEHKKSKEENKEGNKIKIIFILEAPIEDTITPRKKVSKITLQMQKKGEDINDMDNEEIIKINSKNIEFLIHFYFKIDDDNEYYFSADVSIEDNLLIKDLIEASLKVFNENKYELDFQNRNYQINLKEDAENLCQYELRYTLPDLRPDTDLPPIYPMSDACDFTYENLTFVVADNRNLILNPIENDATVEKGKVKDGDETNSGNKCFIF